MRSSYYTRNRFTNRTKVEQPRIPVATPTEAELDKAWQVRNDFMLHFYQMLLYKGLAEPGKRGTFSVDWDKTATACLRVVYNNNPELCFTVRTHGDTVKRDTEFMANVNLILDAVKNGKAKKTDPRHCCGLAEHSSCVCSYSYTCVLHGRQCQGTHD